METKGSEKDLKSELRRGSVKDDAKRDPKPAGSSPKGEDKRHPEAEEETKPPCPTDNYNERVDLWQNIAQAAPAATADASDVNILVIGGKASGKSTLIQRFLKGSDAENPRPTTALDYSHGKKEEGKKTTTAHFWEIGGGGELHNLIDIVITPETIHTTTVVIVADLSDPRILWDSLISCLRRVSKRVDDCFAKMKQKQSKTPARLAERQKKKLQRDGKDHPDIDSMRLLGIPIVIVGSKSDFFMDNPHIRVMAKTLRYIAHLHAAYLIWTSMKEEKEIMKYRQLMGHTVFSMGFPEKYMNTDYTKGPLLVWPGRDSFQEIGQPTELNRRVDGWQPSGDEDLDRWKMPYDDAFPPRKSQKEEDQNFERDLLEDFAETEIDAVRKQKDAELEAQRKEARKTTKSLG